MLKLKLYTLTGLLAFTTIFSTAQAALEGWEQNLYITDKILLNVPQRLETEHLILRMTQAGDGKEMHKVMMANQKELAEWMPWPWLEKTPTVDQIEIRMRRDQLQFLAGYSFTWNIYLKPGAESKKPAAKTIPEPACLATEKLGPLIGQIKLHTLQWHGPQGPSTEFAYFLDKNNRGKGLIDEAINIVSKIGFEDLGLKKLIIRAREENKKSVSVAKRLGFKHEKTWKKEPKDKPVETWSNYIKLKEEPAKTLKK